MIQFDDGARRRTSSCAPSGPGVASSDSVAPAAMAYLPPMPADYAGAAELARRAAITSPRLHGSGRGAGLGRIVIPAAAHGEGEENGADQTHNAAEPRG